MRSERIINNSFFYRVIKFSVSSKNNNNWFFFSLDLRKSIRFLVLIK